MADILNWIPIGELLELLLAAIIAALTTLFSVKFPHRWLWKFNKKRPATICLATSEVKNTGHYLRAMTGIGQVQALAKVIPSILAGYDRQAQP